MYGDLESQEQRLRDAFAFLESKNVKRALVEINKLLRKNPKSPSANALKALILLKSAKMSEANEIMNSVMREPHTDRDTLNFMSTFYRELNREETLQSYLMASSEKFPNNENLLVCLFFIHVRKCDFNAQQAIARKLCQNHTADRGFRFWMALSTMLQGEKDPALAKRMFLPLAERILEKVLNEGFFFSHKDIIFYLTILKRMEKYAEALKLLNDKTIMSKINELEYQHDYSSDLLELNFELGNWSEMLRIARDMLEKDCDNWFVWEKLLKYGFQCEDRVEILLPLINRFVKKSPDCRGPHLALIDFSANLIKRGIKHPNAEEPFCINLAKQFFDKYGRKSIGALDLSYALPLLIKSEESRVSFIESLIMEIRNRQHTPPISDSECVHYAVCAYRMARANGVPLNLVDLISAYELYANKTEQFNEDPKEILPADGLLQLAVSELLDPMVGLPDGGNALGRLLLAAYWLTEVGLKHSPANHFIRLQLSSILSPGGGLICTGRQLKELVLLNLKETLNISLGHVAMAPGPMLTIFGGQILATALPKQQSVNLINFYKMLVNKIQSIQRDTESWLVCAYRRHAFNRIHECTKFLYKLSHSDSILFAQSELVYYRVLVTSDSFDGALEQMGNISNEIVSMKEALSSVCDNRDFSVVPEFSHRIPELENRKQSFDHLCAWMNFRVDLVNLFGTCSKLVMKAVPCIDQAGSGELNNELRKDLKEIVDTIQNQLSEMFSHVKAANIVVPLDYSNFEYTDLLLKPEVIFMSPPPLPKINMTSFYVNGPFTQTLVAGIDLLQYLTRLLDDTSDDELDIDKCPVLQHFNDPLLQFIGESPGLPSLPLPPQDCISAPLSINPSSVLLVLGVAIETLAMATLFVSAAVTMLRPRRFVYRPLQNNSKKCKKQQHKKADNELRSFSHHAKRLDQVAGSLHTLVIPQLDNVAGNLREITKNWARWATQEAAKAFTITAMQTARAVLKNAPKEKSFSWYPEDVEDCASIYKEMADDLACGFNELSEVCELKRLALGAALNEVDYFTTSKEICPTGKEISAC